MPHTNFILNPHMLKILGTQDLKECEAINYDRFDEVKKPVQKMSPKNDIPFGKSYNFKVSHSVETYSSLDSIT